MQHLGKINTICQNKISQLETDWIAAHKAGEDFKSLDIGKEMKKYETFRIQISDMRRMMNKPITKIEQ